MYKINRLTSAFTAQMTTSVRIAERLMCNGCTLHLSWARAGGDEKKPKPQACVWALFQSSQSGANDIFWNRRPWIVLRVFSKSNSLLAISRWQSSCRCPPGENDFAGSVLPSIIQFSWNDDRPDSLTVYTFLLCQQISGHISFIYLLVHCSTLHPIFEAILRKWTALHVKEYLLVSDALDEIRTSRYIV